MNFIARIVRYKKILHLVNPTYPEVLISAFLSLIILIVALCVNLYDHSFEMVPIISNILLYLFTVFVTLIGFNIAGVALISTSYSREFHIILSKSNKSKDNIEIILSSYLFSAFMLGLQSIIFLMELLIIATGEGHIHTLWFHLVFALQAYLVLWSIFYNIGLLNSCIQLFVQDNKAKEIVRISQDASKESIHIIISAVIDILEYEKNLDSELLEDRLKKVIAEKHYDDVTKTKVLAEISEIINKRDS